MNLRLFILCGAILFGTLSISGCSSSPSNKVASVSQRDCSASLTRVIQRPPPKPNLSLYVNDARKSRWCIQNMTFDSKQRSLVRKAKRRSKIILGTPIRQLAGVLATDPFTSTTDTVLRLQNETRNLRAQLKNLPQLRNGNTHLRKQLNDLKRDLENIQRELKKRASEDWIFDTSDFGPFAYPKKGI